ncbi:diacylglycerol kinase family protein [Flavobacterium coralii]|uniref:diacylglycerol/lipid kinase family protein n=1 Tax=Flavobacterium coralii TaxID=2838017 RepID=UPI000C5C5A2E|nr:lipid kinase [Flavobacterium sp.]|tara:strand:- start:15690 stop:16583 length:894 start_codon:yes stop_codon:yes gene_type:complete
MKRYIHFIVNPISGKGTHRLSKEYLQGFFSPEFFRIEVDYTEYRGHAIALSRTAAILNADTIVACGGDGTIHEVASALVGTDRILGIVPVGSGNGLASNLNIPRNIESAIKIIAAGHTIPIDVGKINEYYFFSNTGTGIDALVIKHYEKSGKRTLLSYVKASLSASLKFKPKRAAISFGNDIVEVNPFMLFISNSNEMGYSMSLTPEAKLNDGLLDVIIIPEISFFEKIVLGWYVLRNRTEKFKKAQRCVTEKLLIEYPEKIFTDTQIDGEYYHLRTNKIDVTVLENGLHVIVCKTS